MCGYGQDRERPLRACEMLAEKLAQMPSGAHLLSGRSVYYEWSPKQVRAFGEQLLEDSCLISICAPDFETSLACDSTEPVYGTRYNLSQFEPLCAPSDLEPNELCLPVPNPFIATDFTLFNTQLDTASSSVELPSSSLWPHITPEIKSVTTAAPRLVPTEIAPGIFWWPDKKFGRPTSIVSAVYDDARIYSSPVWLNQPQCLCHDTLGVRKRTCVRPSRQV